VCTPMAMNLRVVQANEFFETAFHTPLLHPPCHHIAASHDSARKRDRAYSRTFQGVLFRAVARRGCKEATHKRQTQHHPHRPPTNATFVNFVRHGSNAGAHDRAMPNTPQSTQPQLCESRDQMASRDYKSDHTCDCTTGRV